MIQHGNWVELHDVFDDILLIKRSSIFAISKDITGQTVVHCDERNFKVKESFSRVAMEVRV